ncbi:MAG: 4-hydroxybenzoate octaprenyltransferase [Undibacterium sp.]|nr:4-hydroxybenzoate octaprenyltransferase [Undibacterium sp.]
MVSRLSLYIQLVRLDKPIGILLLLWPTLVALWLASEGRPTWSHLLIFGLGTVLMRSSGCAINDYADRDFDKHVARTAQRPITSGKLSAQEALIIAAALALISFGLIQSLNTLTKLLSIPALFVAASYPYFKRFFAIPQAYLGIAFGFGIPMAFAAVLAHIPWQAWVLLVANVFWAIAYDTEYAMVDREDDLKIGIKTSAITFGKWDVFAVMASYAISLALIAYVGYELGRGWYFFSGIVVASLCALYHYRLIKERERMACFRAFKHNNYLGAAVFIGLICDYLF